MVGSFQENSTAWSLTSTGHEGLPAMGCGAALHSFPPSWNGRDRPGILGPSCPSGVLVKA